MPEAAKTNDDYLERIANASVYDVARETPLELAKNLSARFQNRIWLKREDLQPVFSFKLRGAYNKMSRLPPLARIAARKRRAVLASNGPAFSKALNVSAAKTSAHL